MEIQKKDNNFKEDNHFKSEPILAVMDDINQMKSIGYEFWQKEGVYPQQFYISAIKQNLSYVIKVKRYIIIAFCLVRYHKNIDFIGIDLLCVKKDYQRKGIGKNLLEYCIENCKKLGYKNFYLHVATTNIPAFKLYSKLGFKIKDTIKNYYFNDQPPDKDAYLMTLTPGNDNETKLKEGTKSNMKKKTEIKEENKTSKYRGNNCDKNYKQYKNNIEIIIDNNENSTNTSFGNYNINNNIYKNIGDQNPNKTYYHNIDNNKNYKDNINNNIYKKVLNNNQNINNINNNIFYYNSRQNYINNIYNNIYEHNNYNITSYTKDYWNRVNHKFHG